MCIVRILVPLVSSYKETSTQGTDPCSASGPPDFLPLRYSALRGTARLSHLSHLSQLSIPFRVTSYIYDTEVESQ